MFSTWVPLVQIKTALIGDDSGGSRSNNDTNGGGYMFGTSRGRIWWGWIDQASRCEVGGAISSLCSWRIDHSNNSFGTLLLTPISTSLMRSVSCVIGD
jgi:hypothetical protein